MKTKIENYNKLRFFACMTRTRMFRVFPNNYVFSGTMYNNTSSSRGGGGTYFTRSAYDEDNAYLMSVMDFGINVGNTGGSKTTAGSVRCMMR